MPQAIEALRWTAVEQLQRRALHSASPFQSAVAEHAIGLALSQDRPVTSFLARNAFVDARKVITARERRSRIREVVKRWESDRTDPHLSVVDLVPDDGADGERAFLWADAYHKLRQAVALRHNSAAPFLDLWREGRGEHEAADQLRVSLGSIKKLKRLIRDTASELLDGDRP